MLDDKIIPFSFSFLIFIDFLLSFISSSQNEISINFIMNILSLIFTLIIYILLKKGEQNENF